MKKTNRCGNCGSFSVKRQPVYGPFPWKDFRKVFLIKPIKLNRCQRCKTEQLEYREGHLLDHAIESSIQAQTKAFIKKIMHWESCTQVDLAKRLGVTPEYLSALKAGARTPGFQTFNFLKTLALDKKAFAAADPDLPASTLKRAVGW